MILITGGAGFIGSHAAVELLNEGYEIAVIDSLANSRLEAILRIGELTGKEFPFYEADLHNTSVLESIFQNHKIETVMHFAGLKSVGESLSQPLQYYFNNIAGTLQLCEVMKKHEVKQLVFSSSATVYGKASEVPVDETFPLSALNPYGRTKLMIEEFLHDLYDSDPSWKIAVLRYFNPVGAHESGRIGEDPTGVPNNLMPYITQVAIGKRSVLQIFGDDYETPDGTGIRDYIHVTDLVKGHIQALRYLIQHDGIETFNLGTGKGYSVLDLVNAFRQATATDVPYQIIGRREGDSAICCADPGKAEKMLNWRAEKDLMDMCRDSWNWQTRNPAGYLPPVEKAEIHHTMFS